MAVRGAFRPSESTWQQLRAARHRNCIRQLVATKSIGAWRQLLSRNVDTARLLAQAVLERHRATNEGALRATVAAGEESGDE